MVNDSLYLPDQRRPNRFFLNQQIDRRLSGFETVTQDSLLVGSYSNAAPAASPDGAIGE